MFGYTKLGSEIRVDTASSNPGNPQITTLSNGGFVVVWDANSPGPGGDNSGRAVKAQVFTAEGVAVGSEILVNTATIADQNNEQVTALSNGGFVVTWGDSSQGAGGASGDASSRAVKAQVFAAGGTAVGSEILVNTATAGSQDVPEITALSNGGFVVTWQDFSQGVGGTSGDADGYAVKAQVFAADGAAVGSELLVNTATAGNQDNSQITALSNGGFVVTWKDESLGAGGAGGDTSGAAVKAQVFAAGGAAVGGEILVNTATAGSQDVPQIAALSNGGFVVTWADLSQGVGGAGGDASWSAVKAQVFAADGTPVGTEILVNTTTTDMQVNQRITVLSNGGFVVTWEDAHFRPLGGYDYLAVRAQVFTADGAAVGSEILVNTTTTNGTGEHPQITALSNGGFVVTWEDTSHIDDNVLGSRHPSGYFVTAQAFAADGTAVGSEISFTPATAADRFAPQITALSNGGFVVTWNDVSPDGGRVVLAQVFAVINQAPVNTVPGAIYTSENIDHAIAGLSVNDPDATSLTTTLHVDHGTLTVAALGGATVGGSGTDTVTLTGSVAQINAALAANNVIYHSVAGFTGTDALTVFTQDAGGPGSGPLSDTDTVAINVETSSDFSDTFYSDDMANNFDGGAGSDTVSYANSNLAVIIDLGGQITWDGVVNDTLSSIENAIGSSKNDSIYGDAGNNVLDGGNGGNDLIDGGAGIDTVSYASSNLGVVIDLGGQITWDGVANDTLSSIENAIGSSKNDSIYGDAGNNVLDGGNGGTDLIDGGGGSDTVSYASSNLGVVIDLGGQITWDGVANDTLSSIENAIGSSKNDSIYGDAGNNVLDGGNGGADLIDGGAGIDTVSYASSNLGVVIDLGGQITWDGVANDTLSSIENAIGSSRSDTIYGDAGNNVLDGGNGGTDLIDGGGGSDTVSYASSNLGVVIDLGGQITWDGVANDTLSSIENAIGSSKNDSIYGDAGNNVLDGGNGGNDLIDGGAGIDTVSYASSNLGVVIDLGGQITWDGVANDTLSSIENAIGSSKNDSIYGDAGNNVLDGGNGGTDLIDGGGGSDTVSYASSNLGVVIDLGGQITWDGVANDTLSSIENAIGSSKNDSIYGDAGNNVLDGGNGGNDLIDGGGGSDTVSYASSNLGVVIDLGGQITWDGVANDTLSSIENAIGSSKNDSIYGDAGNNVLDGGNGGNDLIDGGAGIDTVSYASSNLGVVIDLGGQITWDGVANDTLSSIENAIGSSKNDSIYGDAGNNVLDGGNGGTDLIDGGGGSDTVSYASSNLGVVIDLGGQITWDGVANDTLSSIENAIGSSNNDSIYGDAGNNVLDGGAGIDFLTGSGGNDTFVFHRGEAGGDTIADFAGNDAAAGDQLQFSGYGTSAQGASLTAVDATHWSINSADGMVHDIITLSNGANIHASDYFFV